MNCIYSVAIKDIADDKSSKKAFSSMKSLEVMLYSFYPITTKLVREEFIFLKEQK